MLQEARATQDLKLWGLRATFISTLFLVSACTQSVEEVQPEVQVSREAPASALLSNQKGENNTLTGVARLEASMVCSGFLVGQKSEAPAYLVTSGHCVQDWENLPSSLEVQRDRPLRAAWTSTFHLFRDTAPRAVKIGVKKILFATMRSKDIAVLELNATLGDLQQQGVTPLNLSNETPKNESPIRIVGIPEQGLPPEQQFLRVHTCIQEPARDVMEWIWYWPKLFSNHCPEISGGSSGSPLLDASQKVFALVTTTSRDAKSSPCSLGHPCEVKQGGYAAQAATNYAVSLAGLGKCWNANGTFNSRLEECPLPDASHFHIKKLPAFPSRSRDALAQPMNWNVELEGEANLRVLSGPAGRVDCFGTEGFSVAQALSKLQLQAKPLPEAEGIHLLCVKEQKEPIVFITRIDNTAPKKKPRVQVDAFAEGVTFMVATEPPELANFLLSFGKKSADCRSLEGNIKRGNSWSFDRRELPLKVCYRAEDEAGNLGPWLEYTIAKYPKAKKS